MPVTAPSSFGYVAPYFDRPDEADQQGAPEHDSATGNDGEASARSPRDWLSNFEAPSGIAAQIQAQVRPRPQDNQSNTQAQTGQATIGPSPGYLADLEGIAKSDLSVGDKLEMAWNTTKSYWRTSDTAQGATQIANGTLEVAGGVTLVAGSDGLASAIGVPVAVHGADTIGTGIDRIWYGGDGQTATYKGVKALTGSPDVADAVDRGIPFLGSVAGAGVVVTALNDTREVAFGGLSDTQAATGGTAANNAAAHPLQGMTPEQVVDQANRLGLKTQPDQALLWSGLGRGSKGATMSQAYAAQFGGTTLEMTPGGSWLNGMDLYGSASPFTSIQADQIWNSVSRSFAEQTSGQVRVLQGQVRPESIFQKVELPALQSNPNILGIDKLYLKPRFIFGGN